MEPKLETASDPSPPAAAVPPEPTLAQNCTQLKFSALSYTKRPWWWDRYHKHGRVKPPKKLLPIMRDSILLSHRRSTINPGR